MAARMLSAVPVSLSIFSSKSTESSSFSSLRFPSVLKSNGPESTIGERLLKFTVPQFRRRRLTSTTAFSMLPTADRRWSYCEATTHKTEVFREIGNTDNASEKRPKWSQRAVKSFGMGELEARKLKYPTTGTEALLMGILVEGTNPAAKFLRGNGILLSSVREETVRLLGKSDMYFFSPEHPPLTESAQRALDWAIDEKQNSGESGEVTTVHLLLGIWSEVDSAGHKILASLGFTEEKASELAKYVTV